VLFDDSRELPIAPGELRILKRHDGKLTGTWAGPMQPLLEWICGAGVSDVSIAPPDLEDLFMTYYADAAHEPAA